MVTTSRPIKCYGYDQSDTNCVLITLAANKNTLKAHRNRNIEDRTGLKTDYS